jgi:outer membrane protein assembly factor BamD
VKPSVLVCDFVLVAGCASFGNFVNNGEDVVFDADADRNIEKGEAAMTAKNFAEAARYFEFVKTKYPYLEVAKTAELRLGDCDFERERFTEARDRFSSFVRLHPTHPKVDYAAFRAALTHYKDIPSDFFILPPSTEKDQVEVRNALAAMVEFTRSYPESSHVKEAQVAIVDVKRRLAEHELYVADFYAKRGRWPAVVTRLSVITKEYGGIGYDERAYFGISDAYKAQKNGAKAAEVLRTFVTKYPNDPAAKKAEAVLASKELERLEPAPTPAPAPAPQVAPVTKATPDAGS